MKYIQLDPEEMQILGDYEKGEFTEVKDTGLEKKGYLEYAKNSLEKSKNINIRLSLKDIQMIKRKAAENGLPYQTLIASVLHRYSKDKLRISL